MRPIYRYCTERKRSELINQVYAIRYIIGVYVLRYDPLDGNALLLLYR